jgi:hypothetical protein
LFFCGGSKNDNGGSAVGSDFAKDAEAVDLGELEVQEDQCGDLSDVPALVGASANEIVQGFQTVFGDDKGVCDPGFFKGASGELDVAGIVFNQENCVSLST